MNLKHLAPIAALSMILAGSALAYSGEDYVVCNLDPNGDNFLALRSCGSSKCQMLRTLGPGTFLLTLEPYAESGWRQVMVKSGLDDHSYSGPDGWVYDKYICRIQY